jgi:hypothetical protein
VLHKGLPAENNAGMVVRPEAASGTSFGVLVSGVPVSEASGPEYGSETLDPDELPWTLLLTFGPELQPVTPIASATNKERVPEGRGLIEAKTVHDTSTTRAGGRIVASVGRNRHK